MIDALADDVRSGVPVVDVWQRFELPGRIARRLVGATDYNGLYEILERHGMPIGFRPADIAAWVWDGKMSAEEGMDILGIESPVDFTDFLARWIAGET